MEQPARLWISPAIHEQFRTMYRDMLTRDLILTMRRLDPVVRAVTERGTPFQVDIPVLTDEEARLRPGGFDIQMDEEEVATSEEQAAPFEEMLLAVAERWETPSRYAVEEMLPGVTWRQVVEAEAEVATSEATSETPDAISSDGRS